MAGKQFRVNAIGSNSDRMISEFYQAANSGWREASLAASFVWKLNVEEAANVFLNAASHYGGETGIKINNDGTGLEAEESRSLSASRPANTCGLPCTGTPTRRTNGGGGHPSPRHHA